MGPGLDASGTELAEIMDHVGWTRRHTGLYYLQLAKVLNTSGASAKLTATDLFTVTTEWQDLNTLKRFVCAFLADTSSRKRLVSHSPSHEDHE